MELSCSKNASFSDLGKHTSRSRCSYCSTRSCQSCNSEDTGYSSDVDLQSGHACPTSGNEVLDSESTLLKLGPLLHRTSKIAPYQKCTDRLDHEADDGVSVDIPEVDKYVLKHVTYEPTEDMINLLKHCAHPSSSSSCERHSRNLCVQTNCSHQKSNRSETHKTCKCDGVRDTVENPKRKPSDFKVRGEVVIHLRTSGYAWNGKSMVSWFESVLGIVPGHIESDVQGKEKGSELERQEVVVQGLVPNGMAIKNKDVLIGELYTYKYLNALVSCHIYFLSNLFIV